MSSRKRFLNGLLCFCYILSTLLQTGHGQDFGYDGNIGPQHWGERFHQCVGKHQSPINILEHEVEVVNLTPINFTNFDNLLENVELINNGHTVVIDIKNNPKPMISGGPLVGKYEFSQLHFHWGTNDAEGSENTINNNSFPMELHIVFFRTGYGTFKEATEHPDGVTVLAFLFSNSEEDNTNYNKLIEGLRFVKKAHTNTTISSFPPLNNLLMKDRSVYYTYGGSLTTPPCSEVVTWIEFKSNIPLAHDQIDVFRSLNDATGKLLHNFRPTQPLHGRIIRMNEGDLVPEPKYHQLQNIDGKHKQSAANTIKYKESIWSLSFIITIMSMTNL